MVVGGWAVTSADPNTRRGCRSRSGVEAGLGGGHGAVVEGITTTRCPGALVLVVRVGEGSARLHLTLPRVRWRRVSKSWSGSPGRCRGRPGVGERGRGQQAAAGVRGATRSWGGSGSKAVEPDLQGTRGGEPGGWQGQPWAFAEHALRPGATRSGGRGGGDHHAGPRGRPAARRVGGGGSSAPALARGGSARPGPRHRGRLSPWKAPMARPRPARADACRPAPAPGMGSSGHGAPVRVPGTVKARGSGQGCSLSPEAQPPARRCRGSPARRGPGRGGS